MRTWYRFIQIAVLSCLAMAPLTAADPLTPEKKQEEEGLLAQAAKNLNDTCESKIAVSFDWKSFAGVDLAGHSPYAFCLGPLKTLASICDNSEARKAKIQEKIKTLSCVYAGKAGEKEQEKEGEIKDVSVRNGALTWKFNWNVINVNDYMIEFFKKFL